MAIQPYSTHMMLTGIQQLISVNKALPLKRTILTQNHFKQVPPQIGNKNFSHFKYDSHMKSTPYKLICQH